MTKSEIYSAISNIVNLNRHLIRIRVEGEDYVIEPSGMVATVYSNAVQLGTLAGLPVNSVKYSDVITEMQDGSIIVGLPAQEGKTLLVNAIVMSRLSEGEAENVVAPDTGSTAIRENGQVFAVVGFVGKPQ